MRGASNRAPFVYVEFVLYLWQDYVEELQKCGASSSFVKSVYL